MRAVFVGAGALSVTTARRLLKRHCTNGLRVDAATAPTRACRRTSVTPSAPGMRSSFSTVTATCAARGWIRICAAIFSASVSKRS